MHKYAGSFLFEKTIVEIRSIKVKYNITRKKKQSKIEKEIIGGKPVCEDNRQRDFEEK